MRANPNHTVNMTHCTRGLHDSRHQRSPAPLTPNANCSRSSRGIEVAIPLSNTEEIARVTSLPRRPARRDIVPLAAVFRRFDHPEPLRRDVLHLRTSRLQTSRPSPARNHDSPHRILCLGGLGKAVIWREFSHIRSSPLSPRTSASHGGWVCSTTCSWLGAEVACHGSMASHPRAMGDVHTLHVHASAVASANARELEATHIYTDSRSSGATKTTDQHPASHGANHSNRHARWLRSDRSEARNSALG